MSDCKCERDAALALKKRNHDVGCPDAGKKRGKGGKRTPKMAEARASRRVEVQIDGGKDALDRAAAKANYPSGSALVDAMVKHVLKSPKLFLAHGDLYSARPGTRAITTESQGCGKER